MLVLPHGIAPSTRQPSVKREFTSTSLITPYSASAGIPNPRRTLLLAAETSLVKLAASPPPVFRARPDTQWLENFSHHQLGSESVRGASNNPKVAILGEAASASDTTTGARLHRAMQDFLDQRTTIIIAHRLSAVKQADRIDVFEDGHFIEKGSPNEPLQASGPIKLYMGTARTNR